MAQKFKLVQNDTLPQIDLFLSDKATGEPIDLSALTTTVHLHFRKAGSSTVKETLQLAKLPGTVTAIDEETGAQTVSLGAPYAADGSGGRCAIQWGLDTLDTPGEYQGEIEVLFAGGGRMSWYETYNFSIRATFADA